MLPPTVVPVIPEGSVVSEAPVPVAVPTLTLPVTVTPAKVQNWPSGTMRLPLTVLPGLGFGGAVRVGAGSRQGRQHDPERQYRCRKMFHCLLPCPPPARRKGARTWRAAIELVKETKADSE
jgi:hypothetical protein